MACPYFVPREVLNDGSWPHPARLPLGAGWSGSCCASGIDAPVAADAIRDFCNLGNAACPHLPAEREWDAVRFSVASANDRELTLWYVCERAHAPVAHGQLTYSLAGMACQAPHPDPRIQRLANCYVEARQSRPPAGT